MSEQSTSVDVVSYVEFPGGSGYGPLFVSKAFLERRAVRA